VTRPAWGNYFWPMGYFTTTWQLPGQFQQKDL